MHARTHLQAMFPQQAVNAVKVDVFFRGNRLLKFQRCKVRVRALQLAHGGVDARLSGTCARTHVLVCD